MVTWKINEHVSSILYYGHAFGGAVVGAIYPGGREADYGFIEMNFAL